MLDKNKKEIMLWSIAIILLLSSCYAFYYFTEYLLITRIFIFISMTLATIFFLLKTSIGNSYLNYIKESLKEIKIISWPSKKDTVQTTLVISSIVFFMGVSLCLIDMLFFNFVKWAANFG